MIKYLGSKRRLIPWIIDSIKQSFPKARSVLDIFSGTSRVGLALKENNYQVFANDHNQYAFQLARCYVETNPSDLPDNFAKIINHLNNLSGAPGFFTENYSINSRFFHPKNGEKIDAIRAEIEKLDITPKIKSVLLVSLLEAADRVDSTCGIQMAYLKNWADRAHKPMALRIPKLIQPQDDRLCSAHCLDAFEAAEKISCDVAYLDPPYNQHSYRSNYHIWETLVRNDTPDLYGKAHKRMDCKIIKSNFNSKRQFYNSLKQLIEKLRCNHIILSFNDEGFVSKEQLENLLSEYGKVTIYDTNYTRYVGAQIGIYNQKGIKVGNINKLKNKEFLYLVNKQ